ncbi:MAG: hypothetical protein V1825_04290 [Candidatus Falkowbacteria bacterium]|nr:hypothetical protein [Candidatus Parcubacteria bacterium]
MTIQHKQLAESRWRELPFFSQMANIGSETERAIKWRKKENAEYAEKAFERALELFDLTVADKKNQKRLKEILRAREMFADYFAGGNNYHSTGKQWQKYFFAFNFAARLNT